MDHDNVSVIILFILVSNCIEISFLFNLWLTGMRYAVADVKAALCTLVRKYEFSLESPPSKPSQALGRLFFLMDSAVLNIKRIK